jgi:hypothetical protein
MSNACHSPKKLPETDSSKRSITSTIEPYFSVKV